MRTARLRIVRGGRGCCDQVSCPCPGGRGVLWPGPMSMSGGWGCCDQVPGSLLLPPPPPPFSDRMTNTCENITFATRAVIISRVKNTKDQFAKEWLILYTKPRRMAVNWFERYEIVTMQSCFILQIGVTVKCQCTKYDRVKGWDLFTRNITDSPLSFTLCQWVRDGHFDLQIGSHIMSVKVSVEKDQRCCSLKRWRWR